jgi:hypothetical protein
MKRSHVLSWILVPSLCLGVRALADEAEPAAVEAPVTGSAESAEAADANALPPAPPPKIVMGFISNEFTTHYFKRGFIQENQGIIAQPMVNITVIPWGSPTGPINALAVSVGTRESIHSEETGVDSSSDLEEWYEADAWVTGTVIALGGKVKFDTTWVYITTPSDAFRSFQEIDFQLTFNDDGMLPCGITVHPYVLFVQELDGSAFEGDEGNYLEFGMEPTIPILKNEVLPLAVSFPMRIGLGLHDYYDFIDLPFDIGQEEEETFGFGMIGATLHVPITALPQNAGKLVFNIGVDVIFLGDNMELLNHGEDHEIIGRMGLVWSF